MSRIGKMPIAIPAGVEVKVSGQTIEAKGPKGADFIELQSEVKVELVENQILVTRNSDDKVARAAHGLTRSLINNMVTGVSVGFSKDLEVIGTGYTVLAQKGGLLINVGFSHPVFIGEIAGITYNVQKGNTNFSVIGHNKYMVGQISAKIRSIRPPEPFKGKGIRYKDEYVRRKAGKTVGK